METLFSKLALISEHIGLFFSSVFVFVKGFFSRIGSLLSVGIDVNFLGFFMPILSLMLLGIVMIYVLGVFFQGTNIMSGIIPRPPIGKGPIQHVISIFSIASIGLLFIFMIEGSSSKLFYSISKIKEKSVIVSMEDIGVGSDKSALEDINFKTNFVANMNRTSVSSSEIKKEKTYIYKTINIDKTSITLPKKKTISVSLLTTERKGDQTIPKKSSIALHWTRNSSIAKNITKSKDFCLEGVNMLSTKGIGTSIKGALLKNKKWSSVITYDPSIKELVNNLDERYADIEDMYVISPSSNTIGTQNSGESGGGDQYIKTAWKGISCHKDISSIEKDEELAREARKMFIDAKESIIKLKKISSDEFGSITKKEQKAMFLLDVVTSVVPDSSWVSGGSSTNIGKRSEPTQYLETLSLPMIAKISKGNQIINFGMCVEYVTNARFNEMVQYDGEYADSIKDGCSGSFGKNYNYTTNTVSTLDADFFNEMINIMKGKEISDSGRDTIDYGAYVIGKNNEFTKQGYKVSSTDVQVTRTLMEDAVDETYNIIKGFIYWIRNIILSIYMYLIPGIFTAYLFKFIRK